MCDLSTMRSAARVYALGLLLLAAVPLSAFAARQQEPAQPEATAQQHEAHGGEAAEAPHEQTWLQTGAKVVNFAILAGALVYFLRSPIAAYLASRETQIRHDLVTAAEMRAAANVQLAEIERKLRSLPAELDALRKQGTADVAAEKQRIAEAAGVERERLIEQTRREIDMRLRIARRELTEHAAQLAIQVAEQRIKRSITRDDQLRLLDRYTAQLREAR
jgi:F-type H+-transporting ATPase subunit b